MTRPDSIRKFELFYLGALLVGLVAGFVSFGSTADAVDAQLARAGMEGGETFVLVSLGISLVFGLLMWFLIARKAIGFLKWLLLALLLYNVLAVPLAMTSGLGTVSIIGVVVMAMQAAAIFFLFRPDAKEWFARRGAPASEDTFE